MAPILKYVLNKLQIVSIIKRDIIHGPVAFQGMGMKNLHKMLSEIHCTIIVQIFRTDTDLGYLLQTTYECMSMKLGLPECPFKYSYKKYPECTTKS